MNFTIRKGELKDAEGIFFLINELARFEKEPEAVELTIEDIKADGFGKSPKFEVFVADQDGEIIRFIFKNFA